MVQKQTRNVLGPILLTPCLFPVAAAAQDAGGPADTSNTTGWSLEAHGRLQFDAGAVDGSDALALDEHLDDEVRRARIGFEGEAPGGIGFRGEIDVASDEIEITDAYLSYTAGKLKLTAGQHNSFQSLEELTSSRFTSFIERAAFTDAFGFKRRIGVSAQYSGERVLLEGGIYADNIDDLPSKERSADARFVSMPRIGDTQLHFGGSLHYSWNTESAAVRYSSRPLLHFADTKPVDTGTLAESSELGLGLEAAAVRGPLHAVAESFWQHVDSAAGPDNPTFFGGYAEIGYFLTASDTRGYSGGKFGRVKPRNPVGHGGIGAVQVNLRYDYLDLDDGAVRGGRQSAYQLSLVWTPTAYTRLTGQYGRMQYEDARLIGTAGKSAYGFDTFAMRAQFDF